MTFQGMWELSRKEFSLEMMCWYTREVWAGQQEEVGTWPVRKSVAVLEAR